MPIAILVRHVLIQSWGLRAVSFTQASTNLCTIYIRSDEVRSVARPFGFQFLWVAVLHWIFVRVRTDLVVFTYRSDENIHAMFLLLLLSECWIQFSACRARFCRARLFSIVAWALFIMPLFLSLFNWFRNLFMKRSWRHRLLGSIILRASFLYQ